MRILQIIPSLDLAGAETMCANLSLELHKKNNVSIISFYSNKTSLSKKLEASGIKIYYLDKKRGFDLSIIFKLIKIIKITKPNVIHTHRYALTYVIPATIFKKKKIKIIHTIHSIADKDAIKVLRLLQGEYFRKGNIKVVAITENVKKSIIAEYKTKGEKIPIINNGINLKNCIVKKNYKMNGKILNIGRLDVPKNQINMITLFKEVCKKYPKIKLEIIGDGPLKDKIINHISALNIKNKVTLIGLKDSVYTYLNEADIFVLPSLYEGMPMTLIEAMGTGLPIVATNVGGIPNMIDNNNSGILVDDIVGFPTAIIKLLSSEKERERLGKKALSESKKFSSEKMCGKYLKLYKAS